MKNFDLSEIFYKLVFELKSNWKIDFRHVRIKYFNFSNLQHSWFNLSFQDFLIILNSIIEDSYSSWQYSDSIRKLHRIYS